MTEAERALIEAAVDRALTAYGDTLTPGERERLRAILFETLSADPSVVQLAGAAKPRAQKNESGDEVREGIFAPKLDPAAGDDEGRGGK